MLRTPQRDISKEVVDDENERISYNCPQLSVDINTTEYPIENEGNIDADQLSEQQNDDHEVFMCSVCENEVQMEDDSIECECCSMWVHDSCAKLNKNEIRMIGKLNGKTKWFCSVCEEKIERGEMCYDNATGIKENKLNSCNAKLDMNMGINNEKQDGTLGKINNRTENDDECAACNEDAQKDSIKCGLCDEKFHNKCVGIRSEVANSIEEINEKTVQLLWLCYKCRQKFVFFKIADNKEALKVNNGVQNDAAFKPIDKEDTNITNIISENGLKSLENALDHLKSNQEKILTMIQENKNRIETLDKREKVLDKTEQRNIASNEKSFYNRQISYANNDSNANNRMLEDVDEQEERRKKSNNLVIYNVPESRQDNPKTRIEEDTQRFEDILIEGLKIRKFQINKVIRIGRFNEEYPRPILVEMRSEKEKWHILGKAKDLRNSYEFGNIYINRDMTAQELKNDKELREELKYRKQNGEQCMIKNGQIIRKRKDAVLGDYFPQQTNIRLGRGRGAFQGRY